MQPMRPETVYWLVRRLRRQLAGRVPERFTPHWFRHTHATALLLSGIPAHVVSRRLGHTDVQTTLNIYAWVTEDAELRTVADWRAFTAHWRPVRCGLTCRSPPTTAPSTSPRSTTWCCGSRSRRAADDVLHDPADPARVPGRVSRQR